MNRHAEPKPRIFLNVPYGPEALQALDLYLPAHPDGARLVLVLHGGAWSVGDKEQYAAVGSRLAWEGLAAAVANYRLSPAVQHPTHAEDAARALAWCYRHASGYGLDPEGLCLLGHSAGAHLAALIALDPRYLAAEGLAPRVVRRVLGVAGVGYDLNPSYATPALMPFLTPVFGDDCAAWPQAAPVRYVTGTAPPFLLIHGLCDTEAPPASTEVMAAALARAGVPTQLVLLPDEGHFSVMLTAAPQVIAFLQSTG